MTKSTYAIMGASGHIGHVLAGELLKKGHKVRALCRDSHKLQDLKAKGAEILLGDFTNETHLARAFKGCRAVFSFTPPGYDAYDFDVVRDRVGEAIAHAVVKEHISHVLNLSSLGAQLPSGTGPIKELHLQEQRLNSLSNLNVLHFRPTYFMENLLTYVPTIQSDGVIAASIKANLPINMVATRDIALKMAELLDKLTFTGSSVFEFVGPKTVTMHDAALIMGKALKKPNLTYVHLPYDQLEEELIASGMKHQVAKEIVEMQRAFNEGKIVTTQTLTAEHKGRTTLEEFCQEFSHTHRTMRKAA
jgi:uncharacterized protein YbjT (DUF2867 family)